MHRSRGQPLWRSGRRCEDDSDIARLRAEKALGRGHRARLGEGGHCRVRAPGMSADSGIESATLPVAAYKRVLQQVLDRRPSGMRQRLAEALGKNRSFISQISNPVYPTPIPAQHVERIFEICHFSKEEKKLFLAAYRRAHPRRLQENS